MSRRVRDRGPRRRCASDRTLVRTRPAVNVPPPPIPLHGLIYRMMTPTLVSDYEGLATATWSTGVTGNFGSLANSSWNCWYYHIVRNDPRTAFSVIMPPVRWQVAGPASNGGTFDFWTSRSPRVGYYPQGYGPAAGSYVAVTDTLLPTGHFAEYQQDFAELYWFPFPPVCTVLQTGNPNTWRESSLQAIAPTTSVWQGYWTIAAIRHRVNGSAVGSLQLNPPGSRGVTGAWRFDTQKGDTYAIDIWYRFTVPPANFYATVKSCGYIPTTRVSNGSRRRLPTIDFEPVATFTNVNFNPDFNYQQQTYSVTLSGHSGWTLKDGSDGPHKMVSGGGWNAAIGQREILWVRNANEHCNAIVFRLGREMPQVEFFPGPLHSAWTGAASTTSPLIYRPSHLSGYRSSVNSTDFGSLGLIPAGSYNQGGTTTFNLVQEITDARRFLNYEDPEIPSAFEFGAGVGILNEDVPTSITMTRVSQ